MSGDTIAALLARLTALLPDERAKVINAMSASEKRALDSAWEVWAHAGQVAPEGDWRVWLIRAGRGFGKTRAGAEWVSAVARATPETRIALVGATAADVRTVMVEGVSGLIAVARSDERVSWRPTSGEVRFANGSVARVYSAETPDALRGPEHHAAWCDEIAKWRYGEAAWDNLLMGMRLGAAPRVVVTTTPRPVPLMRKVMAARGVVETRGRTIDNPHLPHAFLATMHETYAGTRLGRQELDGELIEEVADALWTRDGLEARRVRERPDAVRVVIGVDPPAGSVNGRAGDACGIVAVALGEDGFAYVVEDASVTGASPEGWARAVAACAARWDADRVVAEVNQGGRMVESVLRGADDVLPLRLVRASEGKSARAEPVAAIYERGQAWHVGVFPQLEDELCGLVIGGRYEGPGRSPDRADALVWAMTELMLGRRQVARVRGI